MIRLMSLVYCLAAGGCIVASAGPRSDPVPADADSSEMRGDGLHSASAVDWRGETVARAEELLAGRFAGVQVFRTPGGISVRIRGTTSLMGSSEPLYVVDGMPLEPSPNGLLALNPGDIARIEVLKDIGSIAAYGVRGANGVILITTKRH